MHLHLLGSHYNSLSDDTKFTTSMSGHNRTELTGWSFHLTSVSQLIERTTFDITAYALHFCF
jgi:hypothetical protein